jgi:hypothetical protein
MGAKQSSTGAHRGMTTTRASSGDAGDLNLSDGCKAGLGSSKLPTHLT